MKPRFNPAQLSPSLYKAMIALEGQLAQSSIDHALRHLVKLRVSQINGCAFCIDMHWKDARAAGESEQRLYALDAWEESPFYSDRERAALRWAEAVTDLHEGHVADAEYDRVRSAFSEQEVSDLTFVVAAINAWNRLAIPARTTPGSYQPPKHA